MITIIAKDIPVFWAIRTEIDAAMYSIIHQIQKHYKNKRVLVVSSLWYKLLPPEKQIEAYHPGNFDVVCLISLFDWEDDSLLKRLRVWHGSEPIRIGNASGSHYVNFWSTVVHKYMRNDDVEPQSFEYSFLCYNRKMHRHRMHLTNEMFRLGLDKSGVITLGKRDSEHQTRFVETESRMPLGVPEKFTEVQTDVLTGNDTSYGKINEAEKERIFQELVQK